MHDRGAFLALALALACTPLPGECAPGQTACDGECVTLEADARHCGECGRACGPGEVCAAGACTSEGCGPGTVECDRACVDTATDERHCGGCGAACAPDRTCVGGTCVGGPTDPPEARCDPPIALEDTSSPDHVVGDGTPGSCRRGTGPSTRASRTRCSAHARRERGRVHRIGR